MKRKKFEYKNFHEKPLLQLNPQQYGAFIIDTLNRLGEEGWEVISCVTPQIGQQLTGDLLILAKREKLGRGQPSIIVIEDKNQGE